MNSRKKRWRSIITIILISALNLCLQCDGPPDAVIHITPGTNVLVGHRVVLDSYSSSNLVNSIWSIVSKPLGSESTLSHDSDHDTTQIIPDTPGTYTVKLTIWNGIEESDDATISFEAFDSNLLANAGDDIFKNIGEEVQLDGSNTLPEFQVINVAWSIIDVPLHSEVTTASLFSPDYLTDHFIMDEPGTYEVELYIELKEDITQIDRDTVLVRSLPPQILSFSPMNGQVGTEVLISGKNFSSHVDGNIVKFNENNAAEIINASSSLLTVIVPNGAITGPITLEIVETSEEFESIDDFVIGDFSVSVVLTTLTFMYDMDFTGTDNGIIVGDEGAIFTTSDGGLTWTAKSSSINSALFAVDYASANTCFAVGEAGMVLKSSDGGNSWNTQTTGIYTIFKGVSFVNPDIGFIAGRDPAVLMKTEDGGLSWEDITFGWSGGYDDVFFVTEEIGFATGSFGVYNTVDGGNTWLDSQGINVNNGYFQISMINEEKGWLAGSEGQIAFTSDGGANYGTGNIGTANSLLDIHFINEDNGMAVGHYDAIYKTTDGGVSWELLDLGFDNHHYLSVHMFQANSGLIFGYDLNLGEGKVIRLE